MSVGYSACWLNKRAVWWVVTLTCKWREIYWHYGVLVNGERERERERERGRERDAS